jgi:hypothetical protein
MNQVGKYFNEAKKIAPRESSGGRCEAYGCPLNGSLAHGVNSPWYCRFHYGFMPKDFDAITIKVKKYMSLIEILDICIRPDVLFENDINRATHTVKNYLTQKQVPELYDEINLYNTSRKILSFLHDKIKLNTIEAK